ncbi:hypothetical protein HNV11_16350 [Spirosoma taeanense]|uniref:TIR domain-containing protein n=1 Tax=Spirosoma taeanense TaxID=2735870 RepID=A0A6M5YA46_9BACT|nr:hypothetical protein [Spirosoma taeanense]QJW90835.1 hypothetical protein HNV11_16350 [Spirosoma taeanense]
MASYNFYDNEERPLRDRFLSVLDDTRQDESSTRSLARWQEAFGPNESVPSEEALANLLTDLKAIPTLLSKATCPKHRLFVSHRQIDKGYGLRIAKLANDNGFEFWLDVLDPALKALPTFSHLSAKRLALLTACIIEMGLINSTHVLAVMTRKTKGGEWVPYEYGRVRQVNNTSCWKHPNHIFTLPDYIELGAITNSEATINSWLSGFSPSPSILWKPAWMITKQLP